MARGGRGWVVAVALVVIGFGLSLSLADVLRYPDRLSVLPSLQVDATTYDELSATIAAGGPWTALPAMQPPGFVAILAVVYRLFGHSFVVAKALLWACLIVSTVLAGWLANRVWGRGAALAAMILTATAPALRHYVGTVQYEVLTGTGLLVVLALALKAVEASPQRLLTWVVAAGAAGGALTLVREVFIGVVPIIGLWIAASAAAAVDRRRAATVLVVFLLVFLAPVAWWSTVQSLRHGRTIILTDKGASNLALGYSARTNGTYDIDTFEPPAGLAFIRARPLDAGQLAVRKFAYFWGLLRDGWNVPRPAALWIARASGGVLPLELSLPFARGGWVLIAFVVAMVALQRTGALGRWWVLPACVAAGCAAHVATLSSYRFAVPFLPVVFVVIAGPMAALAGAGWTWMAATAMRAGVVVLMLCGAVAAQWSDGPSEYVYRAVDLFALNGERVWDDEAGRMVRYASAAAGPNDAMILSDEYLPAGRFQLRLDMRGGGPVVDAQAAVARVTLTTLDGVSACAEDVPWGLLQGQGVSKVWIPCTLASEGPVTLVVHARGVADLYFHDVALVRQNERQSR